MFYVYDNVLSYEKQASDLIAERENLVVASAYYVRPYTLWGDGRESGVSPRPSEGRSML